MPKMNPANKYLIGKGQGGGETPSCLRISSYIFLHAGGQQSPFFPVFIRTDNYLWHNNPDELRGSIVFDAVNAPGLGEILHPYDDPEQVAIHPAWKCGVPKNRRPDHYCICKDTWHSSVC